MAVLADHTDLHEIGIERRQRAIKCTGKLRYCFARRRHHLHALGRIGQPRAYPHRQPAAVADLLSAMRGIERGVDLSEIPDMRPMQDRGSELDRLDWILTAMGRERAADEDDRRQPVDKAELTKRIDHVNIGLAIG